MFFFKYFSETSEGTSVITIRTGTEFEETIAVRRKFIHPSFNHGEYYNDIAVLELGNRFFYVFKKKGDRGSKSKLKLVTLTSFFQKERFCLTMKSMETLPLV